MNQVEEKVARLTPQERRCLEGVADHLQASQIAERMGLATATVESHLAQVRKKLGVTSSRGAVQMIRQAGFLHTHYGDGFSRIEIGSHGVASVGSRGAADAQDNPARNIAAVELGGPSFSPGGGLRTGSSSSRSHAYGAGHADHGAETPSSRTSERDPGPGRPGAQQGFFSIPLVPPRGFALRVGLILITALLLVVMLAVLASVHALLQ
jgi:DNA-binding CsgD family transcriptional regulator